jgi:Nitrogen permease regulator 2.
VPQNSQSIFDSTCEYIITGKELSGQIISLSTHNMHIIARPTVIEDERYERNSLLFSVGFVIRRKADPTPYRPLLSRFASVLRSMEIESRFLSSSSTKPRIQQFLNVIVPSLNSKSAKCHMLLDEANALHIQYFPPPKVHAPLVPEYAVPVLLRPEFMLQSLDWDLTINWIVPHINGIRHAKLIAESSKVDEAMVLSCLRVLKHHNVLACVDIFRYSNIYESTVRAQKMLAGDMPGLLNQAYQFVAKHGHNQLPSPTNISIAPEGTSTGSLGNAVSSSPRYSRALRHGDKGKSSSTVTLLAPLAAPASYPPVQPTLLDPMVSTNRGNANPSSYTSGREIHMVKMNSSGNGGGNKFPHEFETINEQMLPSESLQSNTPFSFSLQAHDLRAYDQKEPTSMMTALAILYASCQRNMTLSDILTNRIKEDDSDTIEDVDTEINKQSKTTKTKNRRSKLRSASLASSGTSTCSDAIGTIDWKEVFNHFDHRRFVTFGIVHGLMRRVHEYPIVIKSDTKEERIVTEERTAAAATTTTTTTKTAAEYKPMGRVHQSKMQDDSHNFTSLRRHKSMGSNYLSGSTRHTPPFQPLVHSKNFPPPLILDEHETTSSKDSFVPIKSHDRLSKGMSTHSFSSLVTARSSHATGSLAKKIASAMDGSHCDDELCCMFQKSMKEMKKLVRKYTGNEIISVYSSPEEK